MAYSNRQFVSVFKINGKPILPPVIDEKRRIELNRDRMLAIETERRLKLKRTQQIIPEGAVMGNVLTRDNNLDETLNKDGVASNYDTSAAIDSLLDDNEHTLQNDIASKTDRDIEHDTINISSSSDESHASDVHINTKSSSTVPLTLAIDSNFDSITPKILSPNTFSLHSSPSVGALDESRTLSLYFTPMSGRESFSPIQLQKDQLTFAPLIRSNSYTLDKPSPMLLKHMESSGINPNVNDSSVKSPMAMNRFRNNQSNTSTCIPRKLATENVKDHKSRSTTIKTSIGATKQTVSLVTANTTASPKCESVNSNGTTKSTSIKSTKVSNKTASKRQAANLTSVFKNNEAILRSIYGQKHVAKVQHSNKKKNSSTASIDSESKSTLKPSHSHIINSTSPNPSNSSTNNNNNSTLNTHEILAVFEQQHAALLKRQQEEQKRMQTEFLRQQEELLSKMAILIANKSNAQITPNGSLDELSIVVPPTRSNEKMLIDDNNELPVIVDSNGNRINRFTPESGKCIRRLHYDDNKLNLNNNNNTNSNIDDNDLMSPSKLSTDGSEKFEMYTIEEVRAASVMVAYARGYLIRRLLNTKKILDLRKMHNDTFELLLDISEEDNKNESKSDVEFKFNLLQQLASIGTEVHEIFFNLPMAERMDIIAKDRIIKEQQQLKLNRSKSADNNKTNPKHMIVNGNSHLAKHTKR